MSHEQTSWRPQSKHKIELWTQKCPKLQAPGTFKGAQEGALDTEQSKAPGPRGLQKSPGGSFGHKNVQSSGPQGFPRGPEKEAHVKEAPTTQPLRGTNLRDIYIYIYIHIYLFFPRRGRHGNIYCRINFSKARAPCKTPIFSHNCIQGAGIIGKIYFT